MGIGRLNGLLRRAWRDTWRILRKPQIRRTGALSLLLTGALLVAAWAILLLVLISRGDIGAADGGLDSALPEELALTGATFWLLLLAASSFLMVPVAAVFAGLSMDEVAAPVERLRWPGMRPPKAARYSRLKRLVNFIGLLLVANLLAAVVMLLLLPLIGFFALIVWFGVNGRLLGREYFTLIALRHLSPAAAGRMLSQASGAVWLAGMALALSLSVPILNLAAPWLGALWFTHIFHRIRTAAPATHSSG
ncbi:hypothetical protein HOY34_09765 [Xinfangfangia sp. D13-10-4-6]|uniref:EI24 domain-containing protein n=1 Tax=Pseudogemmobacter hezensis TaxID=2737662 RepID=UPI0015557A8C|nr:EI24 domain-containing protein [Pseudogemmobacter hezensis]NPD15485.1 hypothetical protein [Pseudogemmobacter hezensis]